MGGTRVSERLDQVGFWVVLAGMTVAVTLLAAHSIPDPNVTWDEAGQYWMTQGQAFGTAWGTLPGTLAEGLDLGRHGNILDPVGFTALLWAWIEAFGASPATLRSLPFVFFLGTMVSGYFIGRRGMDLPRTVSILIPSAILTTYVSMQWATEIRPYSIELFGVTLVAALTLLFLLKPSWTVTIGLSAAVAFFALFSRYSFAIFAGASLLTIFLVLWRSGRLRSHWRHLAVMAGVLLAAALVLAWNLGFFDSGDQVWDNYGDPIRVQSLTDFLHMRMLVQINFFYGWHKVTGAFLILGLVAWLWARFGSSNVGVGAALREANPWWMPAWLLVGIYEAGSAFASQMGWSQWNSEFRHSIGLIGAAMVSGLGLLVLGRALLAGTWVRRTRESQASWIRPVRAVGWAVWGALLLGLLASTVSSYADFRRTDVETLGVTVPTRVASALADAGETRWVIDTQLFPSMRYLMEASGIDMGTLAISSATPFGSYGHNDETLLEWIRASSPCSPGETTAVLVANSAETNASVYSQLTADAEAQGCSLRVVPLSEVESLLVIR